MNVLPPLLDRLHKLQPHIDTNKGTHQRQSSRFTSWLPLGRALSRHPLTLPV